MSLRILYFASLREALGVAEETIELPLGVTTLRALRDWLAAQGRQPLARAKNLRCALNQELAGLDTALCDGDEIAFFPPVTGG